MGAFELRDEPFAAPAAGPGRNGMRWSTG